MKKHLAFTALLSAPALVLAGCQQAPDSPSLASESPSDQSVELATAGPTVVVTTNILGSVVSELLTCAVGDDSSMTVLMPLGADPHDFQASSEQVAAMARADLVVANGLFLEEGLVSVIESLTQEGAAIFPVAELLNPLEYGGDGHDDHDDHNDDDHSDDNHSDDAEEKHDDDHGDYDPHFWLDMERMALATELIGGRLFEATGESVYTDCGISVAGEIRDAEDALVQTLAGIPQEQRVLVTDHDAFEYFATAYNFDVVGVVVPGGSTLADPSSRELAALVQTIRTRDVPAIFANTAASSAVAEAVAAEVGRNIGVVPLFVGSLGGPGSGAETYLGMMSANATLIAQALTR